VDPWQIDIKFEQNVVDGETIAAEFSKGPPTVTVPKASR
jgi:hypothetical protein